MSDRHPTHSELREFAAGSLSDARFEEVADHIENCQQCGNALRATDLSPKLVDDEVTEAPTALYEPIKEAAGSVIGHYRLQQKLGEGGMGVVYMAEQEQPVRRKVALKIIKPGMDSQQVIARFEAERQALAMMDHHHIAKVLDAGTTESGRPYFAMELVKGVPITEYCDRNKLPLRERLQMFIPVCQAIQHAHQKGIIHRDIKPSNVLVTLYDGRPVPKVIDFGIAKATQLKLTERTMFTGIGQILGTLEYMSPEQAEMNQLDIDTRSDVYSLGVMLYELLTGSTPITREKLQNVGLEEMLRTIREMEPPKPSTRLSESGEALPSISAVRKVEPAKLSKLVRGDLDWIVMKSLEKDRTRRYESANSFAEDVSRYLNDDAVAACPPSKSYKMRKFVRRHRTTMAVATCIAGILIAATVSSTALALRAMRAEDNATKSANEEQLARADAQSVTQFMVNAFRSPDPERDGRELTVAELLDRAAIRVESDFAGRQKLQAQMNAAIGATYQALGLNDKAVPLLEASQSHSRSAGPEEPSGAVDRLNVTRVLAHAYNLTSKLPQAVVLQEEVVTKYESEGAIDSVGIDAIEELAAFYHDAGRHDDALRRQEQVVTFRKAQVPVKSLKNLESEKRLALYYLPIDLAMATRKIDSILDQFEKALGSDNEKTVEAKIQLLSTADELGLNLAGNHRMRVPLPVFDKYFEEQKQIFGPEHPRTIRANGYLGRAYLMEGRIAEALAILESSHKTCVERYGHSNPRTLEALRALSTALIRTVTYDEDLLLQARVRNLYQDRIRWARSIYGEQNPLVISEMLRVADWMSWHGKDEKGRERLIESAYQLYQQIENKKGLEGIDPAVKMVRFLVDAKRVDEAREVYDYANSLYKKSLANPDEWTLRACTGLVQILRNLKQRENAEALRNDRLGLTRRVFGANSSEYALELKRRASVIARKAESDPDNATVHVASAETQYRQAISILRTLEDTEATLHAQFMLSRLLYDVHRNEEALVAADACLAITSDSGRMHEGARELKVRILDKLGRREEMEQVKDQIRSSRIKAGNAYSIQHAGSQMLLSGRYDEHARLCGHALPFIRSTNIRMQIEDIARTMLLSQNLAESDIRIIANLEEVVERAMKLGQPPFFESQLNVGICKYRLNDLDEAATWLTKAMEVDGGMNGYAGHESCRFLARLFRAMVWFRNGDMEASRKELEQLDTESFGILSIVNARQVQESELEENIVQKWLAFQEARKLIGGGPKVATEQEKRAHIESVVDRVLNDASELPAVFKAASIAAWLQDAERWRLANELMLEKVAEEDDPVKIEFVARSCLALEDTDRTRRQQADRLVERIANPEKGLQTSQPPPGSAASRLPGSAAPPPALQVGSARNHPSQISFQITYALAKYRSGDFIAAKDTLEEVTDQFGDPMDALPGDIPSGGIVAGRGGVIMHFDPQSMGRAFFVLSLARHKLGELESAKNAFEHGMRYTRPIPSRKESSPSLLSHGDISLWLVCLEAREALRNN